MTEQQRKFLLDNKKTMADLLGLWRSELVERAIDLPAGQERDIILELVKKFDEIVGSLGSTTGVKTPVENCL